MAWVDEQLDVLVPSAERLRFRNAYGAVPDATNYVEITDLDITAPLAKGKLGLVAGSVPDQPGEIALSDGLQLLSGASLGDEFTLAIDGLESEWQFTVVGTVRDVLYRNKSAAVITTADMDAVYAGSTNTLEFASRDAAWLIGAPEPEFVAAALSSSWELDRQDFRSKPLCVKSEFESVWGASDRIPLGVGV
jgi:hypothetical protein